MGEIGEGGKINENVWYLDLGDGHLSVHMSKLINLYP